MPTIPDASIEWLYLVYRVMAVQAVFYGLLACTAFMASVVLIRKGLTNSNARAALFAVVLLMFALSTAHYFLRYYAYYFQVPYIDRDDLPPDELAKFYRLWCTIVLIERACYLISDMVVVWRAWVIWYDNRPVQLFFAFCLLATAVTSIAVAAMNVLSMTKGHGQWPSITLNFLGTFPLLFTNFIATVSIMYKAWQYRRFIRDSGLHRRRTRIEIVFLILADSGLVYCIFWIVMMVGDFGYLSPFEMEWFQPHFSGIYVCGIVLLVASQTASTNIVFSKEIYSASTAALGDVSRPMQFNVLQYPSDHSRATSETV